MQSFTPQKLSGDILLVLDRSNSMREATPTGTKWSDMTGALGSVLKDTAGQVHWGLQMYPESDERACVVVGPQVAIDATQSAQAVLGDVLSTAPTGDGTPTSDALAAAAGYLMSVPDGAAKYILLATDGEPNCGASPDPSLSDADATVATVQRLAQMGISTFVIGVSNDSTSGATLSRLAQAGGEARQGMTAYFPTDNAMDLEAAMAVVARQVAQCTFNLDPAPPLGDTISLTVGTRAFPRDQAHMGDGWDFTNGGRAIALFGAACDAVQAGQPIAAQYVCGDGSMCDPSTNQCVKATVGSAGATGSAGTTGSAGATGSAGMTGSAGATGSAGTTGSAGMTGSAGVTGSAGTTGSAGATGVLGTMCHYNAQCGTGGICMNGMCMPHCTADVQCGTGDICQNGNCAPNPAPTTQCTFNADCGAGRSCINATCHASCMQNSDCTNPADICDHNLCQPNWHRVPTCTTNAQCTGGMACVDSVCRTQCWSNADCAGSASGNTCFTGYCFTPNQAHPQCFTGADCSGGNACVDATCGPLR
jgi:hypothetical protein